MGRMSSYGNPADDYIERTLDLNELCIRHPAATYFVMAEGLSMIEAGIQPGDVLVVDRSLAGRHGQIVIAAYQGENLCKYLETTPILRLVPANPEFSAIAIPEGADLDVLGVVTTVIKRLVR